MGKIKIDLITNENIATYKSIRLASLKDSPDAFGSSYKREIAFTDDQWKARIKPNENMNYFFPILINYNGEYVGLASGIVLKEKPKSVHIIQMWVDPNYRGKGLAKALLNHLLKQSEKLGLNKLLLSVTTTNLAAINLYQSFGFEAVGKTEPLRARSNLVVQPMEMNLV